MLCVCYCIRGRVHSDGKVPTAKARKAQRPQMGWIQFTLSDPGVGTSAQSWFAILQRLQQGRWAVGLCHPETSFKMLQAQTQIEGSSTSVTSGCSVRFFSVPFTSIHLFVESIGDLFFRLRLHQIYVVRIHVHSARSNYFEHLWTTPCPIQSTSSPVDGRTGWKHKTWRAAVVAWHLWRTLSLQPLDMFGASSWSHGSWVIPWLTRNASLSSWVVLAKRCLLPMYAYAILRISRCLTFFVNKSLNNCCRRGVWQLRLRWTRCCSQWTIMENRSCKSDSQRQLHESRRTNSIPLGRRGTHSLVFC